MMEATKLEKSRIIMSLLLFLTINIGLLEEDIVNNVS